MATPHSHHYQNTRLALEAGKHVLCEKAFTTNAAQARKLVEIAREKKLFLMEAVWTRYFPISVELRTLVKEGKIGEVKRVFADLSDGGDAEKKWGTEHRMVKLALAGGALLDRKSPFPFQKYSFTLFPPRTNRWDGGSLYQFEKAHRSLLQSASTVLPGSTSSCTTSSQPTSVKHPL